MLYKFLFISFFPIFWMSGVSPTLADEANEDLSCTLQLVKLECIQSEGYATLDAIYFKIGNQEWPSTRLRMGPSYPNNIVDLEGYADINFSGSITIELWDDDTWDSDDFLGSNTIYCSSDDSGVVRFTEDGASYKLYYRVK